ncbi:MAG TPA: 30S ribosomal protein S21 [Mollicutes bacterium]|jgi:small subunit ribosomal protein S21|nr:30S ribosomal protein S21 [Mollicutes bacterium]
MVKVVVRDGKVEDALRSFKQKTARDGLLKKVREKEHYVKHGVKKRIAKEEGKKNSRKRDSRRNRNR